VFTRWVQRGKFFGRAQESTDWIEGLSPLASEAVCERAMPSCYASLLFAELMEQGGGDNAVIAGFAGAVACLATVIEAYHRHHRLTFLWDASASHPLPSRTAPESHRQVTEIISLFGQVETTDSWIAGLGRSKERGDQ
jgi:nicotinamidase-related amidase